MNPAKVESAEWQSAWAGPQDEQGLLALFQRAFGHKMPSELWRWKYAGLDPYGTMVRQNGRPVSFYGGVPRPIRLFGEAAMAVQIGDVMVEPDQRGVLRRRGPFFLAATMYLGRFVGEGKTYPLAFGFPSRRAFLLGERLGLYDKVAEVVQVNWPAVQAGPSLRFQTRPLDANKAAAVERLWQAMAGALTTEIVGVRDFAYMKRRYLDHPTISYRVMLVSYRLSSIPFGVFVVREHEAEVELVDVIAPPRCIPVIVDIARRLAWSLNQSKLFAWVSGHLAQRFAGDSGDIASLDIIVPALRGPQAMDAAKLMDHWWLMGGDTDFR